jgi:hypothetical protein
MELHMNTNQLIATMRARSIGIFLIGLLTAGCGGKKEVAPVPVGEMSEYRDAAVGYRLKYPKAWIQDSETGVRARFFNAPDVDKRFLDPTGPYPDGVVAIVEITKTAAPDSSWKRQVGEMAKMGFVVGKEEAVTVGGKPAVKVAYSGNYTAQVKETGYHIFLSADSMLYDLRFAGFGGLFEAHKAVFDATLASFELPKPAEKGRDETLPSEATSDYDAKLFTFQYPENFNFENVAKGNNELALGLRGMNKSCSIQFTVFGAKGLTLEKVFEQNRGKFATAVAGKSTVGGQPALTLTYPATKDVERRFSFVVRNDKVYRITTDWFKPQREQYLAAYDKVLSSIKFK